MIVNIEFRRVIEDHRDVESMLAKCAVGLAMSLLNTKLNSVEISYLMMHLLKFLHRKSIYVI